MNLIALSRTYASIATKLEGQYPGLSGEETTAHQTIFTEHGWPRKHGGIVPPIGVYHSFDERPYGIPVMGSRISSK
jgi:hypothetical protein